MEIIDNRTKTLQDDLAQTIHKDSRLSVAAACFSIYAFEALKKQLAGIQELRFLFTEPTFSTEKTKKEKREFYIPRLSRERSLCGSEFEIKLKNEMTQKAVARECAEWIRKKVTFKSNVTAKHMPGFMIADHTTYSPLSGFTTVDLGTEQGNNAYSMITKIDDASFTEQYLKTFNELWKNTEDLENVTDKVIENITAVYTENPPEFIYFVTLYNIFHEFLTDISEDDLPNEATGYQESKIWNMLYNFQHDAALGIINKLETYNGCILADSVGLGKTFTALAVIKYYENRNKSVLVLCPKKLAENWNTYKGNYVNNPIAADRLRYDVLYHTDLSRRSGTSNGIDLSRLNWSNYDLVVIDESHNFRNGGKLSGEDGDKENRYLRLLNEVIRKGVKTKVLMLSATPVNNRFNDLKNQLALAYEGNPELINEKLDTLRPIDEIFRNAQKAFNAWSKLSLKDRTTSRLLSMLDFDFFQVLDSVTIARSRKHIETYYDTKDIGTFPARLPPISKSPHLTDIPGAISYQEIFDELMNLTLSIYTPSKYILPSKKAKYAELYKDNEVNIGFTQENREEGIRRLTAINLMKRMESSVHAFQLTLTRIEVLLEHTIAIIHKFKESRTPTEVEEKEIPGDIDIDDENDYTVGKKIKISMEDMDYISWEQSLQKDKETLLLLQSMVGDITPDHDSKLKTLLTLLSEKVTHPINQGNKKVIIFTAFADTADYLYKQVAPFMKSHFHLDTAMVTGSVDGKTTIPHLKADLNTVLTCFSPRSKRKDLLMPKNKDQIDILIATDCISEGQNLQDCDYLVNYDIHWNPVRIIQRFGRIDRIGSQNKIIQLVNFWPDISLDEYINLKTKIETRMKIVDMAATGDDNILSDEEKSDLAYRKEQLQRLQKEVIDLEDAPGTISIMDLGLNTFRLDLIEYAKNHPELDHTPHGLHAVVQAGEKAPEGCLFILKNYTDSINQDHRNRLHPFYMVYIGKDGSVVADYLSPKRILDTMRFLCKGKTTPDAVLCKAFNKETKDGKSMKTYSALLENAIQSIIHTKEQSDMDDFLSGGQMTLLAEPIKGLDDFELISFLVVKSV